MTVETDMPFKSVRDEMHKFKHGTLHSGSKHGPKVKSRKQAIAIALSEKEKADEPASLVGLKKSKKAGGVDY
jgi:predicted transcriptional regulator